VCAAAVLWDVGVPVADGVPMTPCVQTAYLLDGTVCGRPAYYWACRADMGQGRLVRNSLIYTRADGVTVTVSWRSDWAWRHRVVPRFRRDTRACR